MPITITCRVCSKEFSVIPARAETAKYCSNACRGKGQIPSRTGENSPVWQGGPRTKTCKHCKQEFSHTPPQSYAAFKKAKFCSKPCADRGGFRYSGKDHPNYREDARRRSRGNHHSRWADLVIARDNATCQTCGVTGVELHAHHIKPYRDHPELRDDVGNGVTLCAKCHWDVHSVGNAKRVNSGEPLTGKAEGNPEPSFDGNIIEGVTTRGRAYRRVEADCAWCGKIISRRLSDATGKAYLACSHSCSSKYNQFLRGNGSNSPKSALPVKG